MAAEPRNIEEPPLGAEGGGELSLRAEGLRVMPLSSVGGTAEESSEAKEPLNMKEPPLGTKGKKGFERASSSQAHWEN
jgi:hypothetical protein